MRMKRLAGGALLLAGLCFYPSVARASTSFSVNAVLGDIVGGSTMGIATGWTLTGTVDIDTVGGTFVSVSLTLVDPVGPVTEDTITNIFSTCPTQCVFVNATDFSAYGLLDLTGGTAPFGY